MIRGSNDMRAAEGDFRELLEQVQSGSQDATCELVDRYAPHVIRAVRRKLSKAIRSQFDSLDFAQAVWGSFFAAPERLANFQRPDELVRYLAALAHNKVIDEIRRRLETEKYNVNRERSLNDSTRCLSAQLAASQPSPSQVAIADELWSRLLHGRPEHHQQILNLRREGNTHQQIADRLGLNERTVRRVIRSLVEE
jgi:RNA polymerase sigma factor (sigma-70 family)